MKQKRLIAIRASDLTTRQLAELTEALGMSQTEVLTLALDRLHQAELSKPQEDDPARSGSSQPVITD